MARSQRGIQLNKRKAFTYLCSESTGTLKVFTAGKVATSGGGKGSADMVSQYFE